MRSAQTLVLSTEDQLRLDWILECRQDNPKLVERAKIVLLAAKGVSNIDIAHQLNITRQKVARWRQRFIELGCQGIEKDATRPGRKPELKSDLIKQVIELSLSGENTSKNNSVSSALTQQEIAKKVGVSASSVSRIWKRYGIQSANS